MQTRSKIQIAIVANSPGECLGVSGQTGCVPAIVSGELSAQVVGGDTLAEGSCSKRRNCVGELRVYRSGAIRRHASELLLQQLVAVRARS